MMQSHETPSPDQEPVSVSHLAHHIKKMLEENPLLRQIWVRGETSRVTYHSSGHLYFSLKDESAVINAVMWKSQVAKTNFRLNEGMDVIVLAGVTTFPRNSSYQLQILQVIPAGVGKLQQRIQEVKIRLMEEGLFRDDRKKTIPFLPRRVGVVTSPTGAALRDVIRVLRARYPTLDILIAPTDVQGEGAALSIVRALQEIQKVEWEVETVILCRGGGSLEDLMAFNEEIVVRAVAACRLPVITGIGHEIDFTLADFAADRRAATPSQAAEFAVPDFERLSQMILDKENRIRGKIAQKIGAYQEKIQKLAKNKFFTNPAFYMLQLAQLVDENSDRLRQAARRHINDKAYTLERLSSALMPAMRSHAARWQQRFSLAVERLEGVSPLRALSRGYALVQKRSGEIVKSKKQIQAGESIQVQVTDARLTCLLEKIEDREIVTFRNKDQKG